jgi:hypothetical protein
VAKSRKVRLKLDVDDDMGPKRAAQREGRSEQDILRDPLRRYVRTADERQNFLNSVEQGFYELRSGLGESVTGDDDFFESVRHEIRSKDASMPALLTQKELARWKEQQRVSFESYNKMIEKHGLLSDDLGSFALTKTGN